MATSGKRSGGQFILSLVFVVTGMVFLATDKTAIGCAMVGVGLGFVIGGLMRGRKAAAAADVAGTLPPTEGGSGRS